MCPADGCDLTDVVGSVGGMEAAPLRCGERAEGEVGETARGSEALLSMIEEVVEAGEGIVCGGGELAAGSR